ncbi:MAG: hypothetical protein JWO76_757 [Nocardioides sp.]|nr:hypothetical protein [Nocardioides sp.]
MTAWRPALRACAAGVLVLGLVACGSDDDPADDDGTSRDGLTSPGAKLDVGASATVPLLDDAGVVELTVSSIDRGVTDPQKLHGTAYYVRLDATVVSGDGYQFFAEQYLTAWAGSERVMPLASPASVGPCTRAYFKLDPPVGTSIQPCLTFVVPEGGAPIDRVAFYADDDYRIDDDTVVQWSL